MCIKALAADETSPSVLLLKPFLLGSTQNCKAASNTVMMLGLWTGTTGHAGSLHILQAPAVCIGAAPHTEVPVSI